MMSKLKSVDNDDDDDDDDDDDVDDDDDDDSSRSADIVKEVCFIAEDET